MSFDLITNHHALYDVKSIGEDIVTIFLSNCNSMLPVPLNSSKITSSIFEPVSVNAVAIILKDPPFSTLRAAQRIALAFVVH
jgi:hypothetical protein